MKILAQLSHRPFAKVCRQVLISLMLFSLNLYSLQAQDCNACDDPTHEWSFDQSFEIFIPQKTMTVNIESNLTCFFKSDQFPIQVTIPQGQNAYTITPNAEVPTQGILTSTFLATTTTCFASSTSNSAPIGVIGTVDVRVGQDEASETTWDYTWWVVPTSDSGDQSLWFSMVDGNLVVTWEINSSVTESSCSGKPVNCNCSPRISDMDDSFCDNTTCTEGGAVTIPLTYSSPDEQYQTFVEELSDNPPTYHLLDDAMGEIESMYLMDIVESGASVKEVVQRYSGIFEAFSPQLDYYTLVNLNGTSLNRREKMSLYHRYRTEVRRANRKTNIIEPIDYCSILEGENLQAGNTCANCNEQLVTIPTEWAQDPFIVLTQQEPAPLLLTPLPFTDFSDYFAALELSAVTNMEVKLTPFDFNGGNFLNTGGLLLIGADDLASSMYSFFGFTNPNLIPQMRNMLELSFPDEKIEFVGDTLFHSNTEAQGEYLSGTYQPVYHLDLFLTPGGVTQQNGTDSLLWFVGDVAVYNPDSLAYDTTSVNDIKAQIDAIAASLAKVEVKGVPTKVVRIPLPMYINEATGSVKGAYLSLNNCIVERLSGTSGNVYLPLYPNTLPAKFWEEAAEIFEGQGFAVKEVHGYFTQSALYEGASLHCATKVLKRK